MRFFFSSFFLYYKSLKPTGGWQKILSKGRTTITVSRKKTKSKEKKKKKKVTFLEKKRKTTLDNINYNNINNKNTDMACHSLNQ